MNSLFRPALIVFLLVFFLPAPVLAAADVAVTTANPAIPEDELALKLKPLMRAEIKVEVAGWLGLLQQKVAEISEAEIAVKYKGNERSTARDVQAAIEALDEARLATPSDSLTPEEIQARLAEAEKAVETARVLVADAVEKARNSPEVRVITEKAARWFEAQEAAKAEKNRVEGEQSAVEEMKNDKPAEPQKSVEAKKIDEAIEQKGRDRTVLLEYLTSLRAEQTALIDRANIVVDAYEKKGGPEEEVKEYRQYINAVSGITVDVSDAEATWKTVTGWLMSEEGGLRWLKNIVLFVVIVMSFMFLGRVVGKTVDRVMSRSLQTSVLLKEFLVVSLRRTIAVIGILIGLAALEVNVGPLLAVIGAAGFVIAFALQNSLGNFASGILIMVFKPFDVGDLVEIDGVLGKVASMNLLSVLLYTADNKAVIIPNNNVWGSSITNVNATSTRRVDLEFGISYDDSIEQAQNILEELVSQHPLILKEPPPLVRVHTLADSSVNFICRPWVKSSDYWGVYWDLTRTVKERFDKEGVSIPYPQQDVHYYNALPDSTTSTAGIASESKAGPDLPKPDDKRKSTTAQGMDSDLSVDPGAS